jgi:hypothetical protein
MSLPTDPWRNVEHVEIREGPESDRYYLLLLDCGHYVTATAGNLTLINPEVHDAPRKMRCACCGFEKELVRTGARSQKL